MSIAAREITPAGAGAVAVVRVSGAGALDRVRAILGRPDLGAPVPRLVRVRIEDRDLDEALVCVLDPREVEIHLHGSPVLVRALIEACGDAVDRGARPPGPSIEERALARLGHASSVAAARVLLDQCEGALTRELELLARDPDPSARSARLLERARVARFLFEPARVVLAGPVNAGKSTLFNALVGERRAIESEDPGTTRDVVIARALFGPYPVDLADTAGEREADAPDADAVERAGQERARAARTDADLCLWIEPADGVRTSAVPARAARVISCADRVAAPPHGAISARARPAEARDEVARLFRARFALPEDPWTPGAGVPFDREEIERLGGLRAERESTSVVPRPS